MNLMLIGLFLLTVGVFRALRMWVELPQLDLADVFLLRFEIRTGALALATGVFMQ